MSNKSRLIMLSLVMLLVAASPVNAQNILVNAGFEEVPAEAGAMPIGWSELFGKAAVWGENIKVVVEETGEHRLAIFDRSDEQSMGLRSDRIPIQAGKAYEAAVMLKGTVGQVAGLYLEFWNEAGERIANKYVKGDLGEQWQRVNIGVVAPSDAVKASVLLYSYIGNVCDIYFDSVELTEI